MGAIRYLSLFSGIEAATVAWRPLGWECAAVAEVEPFPCAVLAHHYPGVPNLGDVTKITEAQINALGHIDVVVFGSPCQDLSVAGKRKGLINEHGDITRSGLFFTAINIFHWSRARYALWENVPGAFSSNKGRDFASVVEFMAGMDDCPVPEKGWGTEGIALGNNGLLEWCVLDAQWFGVAQRRRRVFALLDTGDWVNRPPILLEPESLRGDTAPSREKGKGTTTSVIKGAAIGRKPEAGPPYGEHLADGSCYTLNCAEQHGVVCMSSGQANADVAIERSPTLNCLHEAPIVAHALRVEGFDASEDGTGRGTPLVPVAFSSKDYGNDALMDCAPTLRAGGHAGSHANAYGIDEEQNAAAELMRTLKARLAGGGSVYSAMQVRRLTSRECERLQGFPDDYTNIPWRKQPTAPDGPRYKALGNSMAVPVMRWIGTRIAEVTP